MLYGKIICGGMDPHHTCFFVAFMLVSGISMMVVMHEWTVLSHPCLVGSRMHAYAWCMLDTHLWDFYLLVITIRACYLVLKYKESFRC